MLLTAREIAERVDVAPATVLRWTRNGDGPPSLRLPSGQLRYPESGFEAWLAARATPQEERCDAFRQPRNGDALAASHTPKVSSLVRRAGRHEAVRATDKPVED